ncbi:MAG: thiopeptide-type bacteriocin biosynthesis domain protein, partial [Ktedonobacteraceae bacterium]|nr:thiopeptide-type bacteriocin biosynthesis domain protein [Ktedonobacteraceae bacterium]
WRVPRYVYLVEGDSRFLLDLEHPYFLRELRRTLRKQATDEDIILQEMLPDFEHLWLRDTHNAPYISELVIPLMPRQSAAIAENKQATGAQSKYCHRIVRQQERQQLPGGEWTSLKLYTAIKRQNDIIAGPMRDFVRSIQEQGLIDSWFFVRYVDPDPHLRIRFHASAPQCQDQLLITALAWGRTLVQDALVKRIGVDEYSREVERYGGPLALDAIERVFCASSHIASDILALYSTRQLTCDPIVTAVLSLDLFFETWGLTLEERLYRIQYWVEKDAYKDLFRPLRKLLCEFLAPWDTDDAIEVNRQRELLRNVANAQARTIRATARCIYELATSGDLWQSEDYILSSLAHMHLNRLQEMSQEQEKKAYACWKYTLESILSRQAADDRIVKN